MSGRPDARAILRRLDDQAYDQLCASAAQLAAENENLRTRLALAEGDADSWREDALNLHEQLAVATGGRAAITQSGALVVAA